MDKRWRKIKRPSGKNGTGPEYNVYVFSIEGVDVAEATLSGEYGRDHYPWEWYTLDAALPKQDTGVTDSLRGAKREVEDLFSR